MYPNICCQSKAPHTCIIIIQLWNKFSRQRIPVWRVVPLVKGMQHMPKTWITRVGINRDPWGSSSFWNFIHFTVFYTCSSLAWPIHFSPITVSSHTMFIPIRSLKRFLKLTTLTLACCTMSILVYYVSLKTLCKCTMFYEVRLSNSWAETCRLRGLTSNCYFPGIFVCTMLVAKWHNILVCSLRSRRVANKYCQLHWILFQRCL